MASPFPGMDPYLEGEMWQEFHGRLANVISEQLLPQLRPKYVALLEKRYVLDRPLLGIAEPAPERTIYPDVHVVQPGRRTPPMPRVNVPGGNGHAAVLEPTVELYEVDEDGIPVTSIEIRDIANRRLVTLIEILSPVNKRGQGAREYDDRRQRLLRTQTHVLEIDLLVQGSRLQFQGTPPPAPYYVYLSRTDRRPRTQIWALPLYKPLPRLPVPLLAPDADVVLDLQAAVDSCFNLVGYEDLLDYNAPPPVGLSQQEAEWVIANLREAGLRQH